MLELLRRRGLDTDPDRLDEMRIDLSLLTTPEN